MGIADKNSLKDVLGKVPETLRALMDENTKLASELDEFRKRAQAEEIVGEMDRKGLTDVSVTFQEKVAALLDSGKDFDVVREALKMASPNLSFASVSDTDADDSNTALEDFILGAG